MMARGRLIMKGWEPAKKEGQTAGYLKWYDLDTKADCSAGTPFFVNDAELDRSPQVYDLDIDIRETKYGVRLTINRFQIVPPNGK